MSLPLCSLLAELRTLGVVLGVDAEGLFYRAPKGAMTPELRAAYRARRGQLRVVLERWGLPHGPLGVLRVDGLRPAGGDAPPCAVCRHPAERFTPEGEAVCTIHLLAPHLDRAAVEEAMAELEDEAQRRGRGERLPQTPERYRVPAPAVVAPPPAPRPTPAPPTIPDGCCEFCPPTDRVRATRSYREQSGRVTRLCARHFAPLARVRQK